MEYTQKTGLGDHGLWFQYLNHFPVSNRGARFWIKKKKVTTSSQCCGKAQGMQEGFEGFSLFAILQQWFWEGVLSVNYTFYIILQRGCKSAIRSDINSIQNLPGFLVLLLWSGSCKGAPLYNCLLFRTVIQAMRVTTNQTDMNVNNIHCCQLSYCKSGYTFFPPQLPKIPVNTQTTQFVFNKNSLWL